MSWIKVDNTADILDRLPAATDVGLLAMATAYAEAIREALAQGYTTGAFVTGAAADSVVVTAVHDASGDRAISVGTDLLYPLAWEVGHMNLYTRHYERVEIWGPLRDQMGPELADILASTILSQLNQDA